ncbi:MAG: hypothetical protein IT297_03860 [Anaerolineae bacterium]|nr:hypothetical protein [Anaerolineae bacterium]
MSRSEARRLSLLLALLCLFALPGCVSLRDPETSFDYTADLITTLDANTQISQSFLSRRPGLNRLQLWLRVASADPADGAHLHVDLYHFPQPGDPLASLDVPYAQIREQFPLSLTFPPQFDPPDQGYLVTLTSAGPPLAIYGRSEDGYPEGALYINGAVRPVDLAFRTSYEYAGGAFLEDLRRAAPGLWLALPLLLLLWAPGRLALELAGLGGGIALLRAWDWSARQALAVGLSLALVPLALLWSTALGLHWNRGSVMGAALLLSLGLVGLIVRRRRRFERLPLPDRIDLALLGLLALGLGFRLAMVRDLDVPAWVDPVHHAVIARLIVEGGGYPVSYAPYVAAGAANYHPGFHALLAGLHWLSGLELSRAMLLLGQVLNALIIPAVYLLAAGLTHDRPAGLFAALIAGFMTVMPTYYTSWGRYTQLTGLLVLPAGAALLGRLLQGRVFRPAALPGAPAQGAEVSKPGALRLAVLSAVAGGGLLLIHYRVRGFLALLMLAVFISELLRSLDKLPLWVSLSRALVWVGAALALGVLVSLPWWRGLFNTLLRPIVELGASQPEPLALDWGYLLPAYGKAALWLALAGLAIAILRARWFGPALALWVGLLFMSANQGVVSLPLAGQINKTSVEIMLFMPIAVLGGYALSVALRALERLTPARLRPLGVPLIGLGMLYVCWLGIRQLMPVLNPTTLLFRQPDRPALAWVAENIPPDQTVLINPFLWGYGAYAGRDGGYWITPLAGVKTMPPNLLYGMGSKPDFARVNRISQAALDLAGDPPALRQMMIQEGVQYLFAGRRGGAFSPRLLANSGLFEMLYAQDGVWVFKVR